MKKCNICNSTNLIQTRLMLGHAGTKAFSLEPKKRGWSRKGIIPQSWVCKDCRHLMFFMANDYDVERLHKIQVK